ncbi:MAG: oxygen-sensitive ribonucleoside-triphosphate reductase [Caudoviricetes sp.]|nr:MAG: oxygen-sensitive ribonucleoside-triphosphate reductase [Caudoviricetes sp.]
MSYSGYYEYICEKGHYFSRDCWDSEPDKCPHCRGKIEYRHSVDQTNGYGENEKYLDEVEVTTDEEKDKFLYSDQSAPKTQIGFEDVERIDKYGNKFYIEVKLYAPDKIHVWRKLE